MKIIVHLNNGGRIESQEQAIDEEEAEKLKDFLKEMLGGKEGQMNVGPIADHFDSWVCIPLRSVNYVEIAE